MLSWKPSLQLSPSSQQRLLHLVDDEFLPVDLDCDLLVAGLPGEAPVPVPLPRGVPFVLPAALPGEPRQLLLVLVLVPDGVIVSAVAVRDFIQTVRVTERKTEFLEIIFSPL